MQDYYYNSMSNLDIMICSIMICIHRATTLKVMKSTAKRMSNKYTVNTIYCLLFSIKHITMFII